MRGGVKVPNTAFPTRPAIRPFGFVVGDRAKEIAHGRAAKAQLRHRHRGSSDSSALHVSTSSYQCCAVPPKSRVDFALTQSFGQVSRDVEDRRIGRGEQAHRPVRIQTSLFARRSV